MTYDQKAVDELLDAVQNIRALAIPHFSDDVQSLAMKELDRTVTALRPARKYHVMPTFEEAAKLAGAVIHNCLDADRYFLSGREEVMYIWELSYNYLRDLTALDKPPGKIPAGKDWSDDDVQNLRTFFWDHNGEVLGSTRAMIDYIKEKYGV